MWDCLLDQCKISELLPFSTLLYYDPFQERNRAKFGKRRGKKVEERVPCVRVVVRILKCYNTIVEHSRLRSTFLHMMSTNHMSTTPSSWLRCLPHLLSFHSVVLFEAMCGWMGE